MIRKIWRNLIFFRPQKVTVVIPVLNEEKTIGKVIKLAQQSRFTDEVIVVDDKSEDRTVEEAIKNNAKVLTSNIVGKGSSMKIGMEAARNEIIVYLDGDIDNYELDVVKHLVQPIFNNECDFVKTTFNREAGRVTELVAKPLLSILFPDLAAYSQPLSGMIAAKKEILKKLDFENDYGVDVGILIDAYNQKTKIKEVNIGRVNNKSKPWQELGKMSREVSMAILKRAETKKILNLDELETMNIIQNEMENSINASIKHLNKLIIFDMDETILMGRFIYETAKKYGFESSITDIITKNHEPYIITKLIANLLKDMDLMQIYEIVDRIKIVPDLERIIKILKNRGYIIAIVSDSYNVVTEHIKKKINADISLSNELEVKNNKITGEVTIPSYFIRKDNSFCSHSICKSNAVKYLTEKYNIPTSNIIAVGNGENDICMVKMAGIGVSFCSSNKLLDNIADKIIKKQNFKEILTIAR